MWNHFPRDIRARPSVWLINISHCHPIPYILYLIQSSSHRATVYLTAIGREGSTVAEIFSFHPTLKLWQVLLPTGHWRKQQPSPTPRHGHHHHHHRISHPTRHQQQLLMLQIATLPSFCPTLPLKLTMTFGPAGFKGPMNQQQSKTKRCGPVFLWKVCVTSKTQNVHMILRSARDKRG